MKTGKTLVELARSLEDIKKNAKDYLVPTAKMRMTDDLRIEFQNGQTHRFNPNGYSHGQVAEYSGVPRAYYQRLQEESPVLLAKNVNHGFGKNAETSSRGGKPETRMIRTYRDDVRALLSSSYRRLDSYDLLENVLPLLADKQFEVQSSDLTDSRLYLKALTPTLKGEVKPGDVVQYGLLITNSDVGAGAVRVEPMIYRLVCKNGMVSNTAIKKFHAGRNMAGDDIRELLTTATQELTDKAFWAQVKDIVAASMRPELFELEVKRMRDAANQRITNFALPDVIELTMQHVGVRGEKTKDSLVAYLANGADGAGLTKYGLSQAFGFAAQADHVNYDQSVDLERAGSRILDLNAQQWRRIAEAA